MFFNSKKGVTIQATVKNFKSTKLGDVEPEYTVYTNDNTLNQTSSIEVVENKSNGKIRVGNEYNRPRVKCCNISYNKDFEILTEFNKEYKLVISNDSPYVNPPIISVNSDVNISYSILVTNINGGELAVIIRFDDYPTTEKIFFTTYVSESGYN